MKEWSAKNKFNSFNSWKGLLYADWYKAIAKKQFLPPVEAAISPIHACNLNCKHCNSGKFLKDGRELEKMPDEHFISLMAFLAWWGVKGVCFAGGGEPSLHTALPEAIRECEDGLMSSSVLTNGTILNDNLLDAYRRCSWVGISIDAGTSETFSLLKRTTYSMFDLAINNIKKIMKDPGQCKVAYKFLLSSTNQYEILEACLHASDLGVHDFHLRPADMGHEGMDKSLKRIPLNLPAIEKQIEECHKLERKDFKVHTVMHKFNSDFTPKRDFSQCYGAPLSIPLCADGNTYFCIDKWYNPDYIMGSHYPDISNILKFWGSKEHINMVFNDAIKKCKTRCTYGVYCKQCEELFINTEKDPMYWRFP